MAADRTGPDLIGILGRGGMSGPRVSTDRWMPDGRRGYAPTVPGASHQTMGCLRALVGVALIVAPGAPMRLSAGDRPSPASLLLMRTIGIRDLVLGIGTVCAARSGGAGDVGRWNSAALASDSLDTLVSLASVRSIGKRDCRAAAALAFTFVCGDLQARRTARSG